MVLGVLTVTWGCLLMIVCGVWFVNCLVLVFSLFVVCVLFLLFDVWLICLRLVGLFYLILGFGCWFKVLR